MTRILVALGLAALFAGGALAASNVPELPILAAAHTTTSTATTTGGTTTTGTTGHTTTGTGTTTTGTTTTGTTTGQEGVREGKIRLCHKPHSKKGGVQIEVSRSALRAHLAHGDTEGACASRTGTTTGSTTTTATTGTTTGTTTHSVQPTRAKKPKKQKKHKASKAPSRAKPAHRGQSSPGKSDDQRNNGAGKGQENGRGRGK